MPIDKIYDLSFWGGFFHFCFLFFFFSFLQFAPMELTDFHQNKFLTYQMLVNPKQVCMCVDMIYASVKYVGSRGERKMQQKKTKITSQWPHAETQVFFFSMSFQLWKEIKIRFLSLRHTRNVVVLPLIFCTHFLHWTFPPHENLLFYITL